MLRNGADVTDAFEREGRDLVGLVDGLRLGRNRISVYDGWRRVASKRLKNHPIEGPIFSGPHQTPFVCKTIQPAVGLGEPLVDNQEGDGFRVLAPDGSTAGWSRNCSVATRVDWLYRRTSGANVLVPLPPGPLPADVATTTTLDGQTVPFIVRRERGTINRFIYSLAMLADRRPARPTRRAGTGGSSTSSTAAWRSGATRARPAGSAINPDLLARGYAIAHSSGNRASVHYNMVLGGETALMTKERFVERYGVPLYTVGVGGSGGAIQQYLYGQNHPGLLDGAIPTHSYPDMVTQTIHVGDCELLERYMDVTDAANPKWRVWDQREWLIGLNASDTFPNPYTGGRPGSTECVNGWRGLMPLAMNPLFGTAGAGTERMDPAVMAAVHWTHWEDVKNVYGVGPDGYARQTWDNVGVQYGLQALTDGKITPAEFLDLNAKAGSWKDPGDMVQEGQPFLPVGGFDPWSMRNQQAPRREGSIAAMNAAYREGLYFDGDIDIPIIDWRPYLEERLDMHNSHQSFASRQRMLDHDGKRVQPGDLVLRAGRQPDPRGLRGDGRVAARPAAARGDRPLLHEHGHRDRARLARLGRDPQLAARWLLHGDVPDPLDVAHRGGRPDPRRRLQVRAAVRRQGDRARPLRLVEAERRRAGARSSRSSRPGSATTRRATSAVLSEVTDRSQQPFRVGLVVVVDEAGADGAVRLEAEVALELDRRSSCPARRRSGARRARRRPRRRCGRAR